MKRRQLVIHVLTVPSSLAFIRGHAEVLRRRGLELGVITSPGDELGAFGRGEACTVWAIPMSRRITPWSDLKALVDLVRILRRERPVLLHAHTPKAGLLGMVAGSIARVPARIYHIRGLPMLAASGVKRHLLWLSERVACALAHGVLCVSHSVRDVAIDEGLASRDKIRVLLAGSGNGVDSEHRFNPSRHCIAAKQTLRSTWGVKPGGLVVGFVGRLVRDKGVVELARAWKEVASHAPGAKLIVVGPIERRDAVPDAILDQLRGDGSVVLTGEVRDVAPLLAAFDLLVLPTYREGFPNVILEAAAMSVPVVATDVPGCRDAVVNGATGRLVPVRDSVALETAILAYLADADMRRRHGETARKRAVALFDPFRLRNAISDYYDEFLRRIPGDPSASC